MKVIIYFKKHFFNLHFNLGNGVKVDGALPNVVYYYL